MAAGQGAGGGEYGKIEHDAHVNMQFLTHGLTLAFTWHSVAKPMPLTPPRRFWVSEGLWMTNQVASLLGNTSHPILESVRDPAERLGMSVRLTPVDDAVVIAR